MQKAGKDWLSLSLCPVIASGATDLWIGHVTSAGGWRTGIAIHYSGEAPTTDFVLTRYNDTGRPVGPPATLRTASKLWSSVTESALDANGSARIQSAQELLVKVTYRFADTQSVCELFVSGDLRKEWVLPNTPWPWFDWSGFALVNSNDFRTSVALEAWCDGTKLKERTVSLSAHSRYAKVSGEICGLDRFLGTIEAGKVADILVVRGNPLDNLRALLDVAGVIHGGTIIRRPHP